MTGETDRRPSRVDIFQTVDLCVLRAHLRHVELRDELLGMIDILRRPGQ